MSDRRYNEDEVAAIFTRAAAAGETGALPAERGAGTGLTLAELQEIGQEAGISPQAVARAAAAVGAANTGAIRRFLLLPLGVAHSVELARPLTEREWEQLVVELRDTFHARGRVAGHGSFRQWTNGHLQALLEPTGTGHRFRLQTSNGSARGLMLGGLATTGIAGVASLAAVLGGAVATPAEIGPAVAVGLGLFGLGALRLPTWARRRHRQFQALVARVASMAATPVGELPADSPDAPRS